jgi:hypothetical protein
VGNSTCSIDGCSGKHKANGWCVKHYAAWRRYGDPLGSAPPKPVMLCRIDDCGGRVEAKSLCNRHYLHFRAHGDPLWREHFEDLPGETWLPVVGYEGLYDVSDLGRVRSLPRAKNTGHLLTPSACFEPPRFQVGLSRDGIVTTKAVHRLVGEAFLGPLPPGLETRHLDGNSLNNAVGNLKYGTHSENMHDQVRHGTHAAASATHCPQDHEYTTANTYINPSSGGRMCRACLLEGNRRRQGYTGKGRWPGRQALEAS